MRKGGDGGTRLTEGGRVAKGKLGPGRNGYPNTMELKKGKLGEVVKVLESVPVSPIPGLRVARGPHQYVRV